MITDIKDTSIISKLLVGKFVKVVTNGSTYTGVVEGDRRSLDWGMILINCFDFEKQKYWERLVVCLLALTALREGNVSTKVEIKDNTIILHHTHQKGGAATVDVITVFN